MRGKRLMNQLKMFMINNPYKRADFMRTYGILYAVGENVSFQPRKIPLYGQLIKIGDNTIIGTGVTLVTHDAYSDVYNQYHDEKIAEKVGCIKIGKNCFIGANSIVLYDVEIGDGSIIAAGAVVTRNVSSGQIWGGVPARCIGQTIDLVEKYKHNTKIRVGAENIDMNSVNELWELFEKK